MAHSPPTDRGGFTADTELLTTDGLVRVAALTPGDVVYTLDLGTGRITPTPVRAIERDSVDELVAIETRRADLRLHPEHRIPFTTRQISTPRFVRAGDVDDRAAYNFVNEWTRSPRTELTQVDITGWLDDYEMCAAFEGHGNTFRAALPDSCEPSRRNSHVGYYFDPETFSRHQMAIEAAANEVTIHAGPNHHRRPYRFDADDFIQLLGWYITEGNVYWSETSHTAQVKIAQETPQHRRAITALFDRLGIEVSRNARRFEFGSVVFGRLLERLCGATSQTKRLPDFVWRCSQEQLDLLLDVLLDGDGDARGTFYTASARLAHDVLRLCLVCGIKPRYGRNGSMWRVYVRTPTDGFRPAQHVRRMHPAQDVYRLTLQQGDVVMAGRNGTFQWIGTG